MIWTDTKNMNGTVGWLKLTGEDDPIVTFFLSLKPDIININARKKFTFRDIDTKLQTVLSDLNIPPFAWSQFEYAANAWLIVRGKEDNADPPRLIASGTVSQCCLAYPHHLMGVQTRQTPYLQPPIMDW